MSGDYPGTRTGPPVTAVAPSANKCK